MTSDKLLPSLCLTTTLLTLQCGCLAHTDGQGFAIESIVLGMPQKALPLPFPFLMPLLPRSNRKTGKP